MAIQKETVKGILFDFDGVVLESANIKTVAFQKLFENICPESPDKADMIKAIVNHHLKNMGISRYEKFRYIYSEILKQPLSEPLLNDLGEQFSKLVMDGILSAPFVNGVLEFLNGNEGNFVFYVISGTPQKELIDIASHRGVSRYFEELYGTPGEKYFYIQEVLRKHRWLPHQVIFIGDAESDYKAANQAGVHFVARVTGLEESDWATQSIYRIIDFTEFDSVWA